MLKQVEKIQIKTLFKTNNDILGIQLEVCTHIESPKDGVLWLVDKSRYNRNTHREDFITIDFDRVFQMPLGRLVFYGYIGRSYVGKDGKGSFFESFSSNGRYIGLEFEE